MVFSSRLIEEAVEAFSRLPGIGRKTALRLVLHLLKEAPEETHRLADAISRMRDEIRFCEICFNVSDAEVCSICSNPARRHDLVCVVENIRDVMAIENTQQYTGVYHVLGGVISPLSGVGPEDLTIDQLVQRAASGQVQEIIMAISPTVEGDTTLYYLSKKLKSYPVKLTTIARGIAFGGELEYADEMTLARSLTNRLPIESYLHTEEQASHRPQKSGETD
ncbi:recombination mediator RecR [Thermoflavifilum thermophilum]|uniref:Recombination protein RecR n=1 Tax=Thermoflavifilum thermophilum TaxID=1393122 RepID=A0A1I7N9K9_9BACT|nr:recombination mediator RecR [Thermoflavifilum thermophilum]SFV31328.1 DNA replication and repair protein RecR [Thermoflavifilum thermophilum]